MIFPKNNSLQNKKKNYYFFVQIIYTLYHINHFLLLFKNKSHLKNLHQTHRVGHGCTLGGLNCTYNLIHQLSVFFLNHMDHHSHHT
jgi:hypothetical protein